MLPRETPGGEYKKAGDGDGEDEDVCLSVMFSTCPPPGWLDLVT